MFLKNFIVRPYKSIPDEYFMSEKNIESALCGIMIVLVPIKAKYNFYKYTIYQKGDAQYYWKPFGTIFNKEEPFINKWYELTKRITNFNKDFISGKFEVKEIHEDHTSKIYLLLNNFLT